MCFILKRDQMMLQSDAHCTLTNSSERIETQSSIMEVARQRTIIILLWFLYSKIRIMLSMTL